MTIRVHIERVVLDGLDLSPADRGRFLGALEAELGRLLASPGPASPASFASGHRERAYGEVSVTRTAGASGRQRAASLGRSVAGAVHGGLSR